MTTKFLDNKICTFKILLSWRFPRKKNCFLDDSSLPPLLPPQDRKFYFYCRLAVSEQERAFFPLSKFWGWGFAQIWCRCFLYFFWLPSSRKRNVQTGFLRRFLVRRFLRPFLRRFLVRRFLRRFLCRFLVRRFLRRFSADFSSTFWRFKNRCSRVTQKCAENPWKNLRRPNGPPGVGKPLTSTFKKKLLTSTFVFRSGGFPFRGFELEWSLVATSLEGFSVTSNEKGYQWGPFKALKRVRGAPPGTENQSGHVKSGL